MNIIGQNESDVIINGTGTNWIFAINSGVTLNLSDLTLTNGTAEDNSYGGAIYNQGTSIITNCTFTNNNATYGGAISIRYNST